MFVWRPFAAALVLGLATLSAACQGPTTTAADATAVESPSASAGAAAAATVAPEGEWFVKTGCAKCHEVSVYGIKPEAQIGPDLSIAVEDVKTRFGVSLEEFMESPSGTMALVLSSQIQLTPEEKKVAIQKLHEAYAAHQKAGGLASSH